MDHRLYWIPHTPASDTPATVRRLLDQCGLGEHLRNRECILLKPNLVEALAPPITTPVALVEAIVMWLQDRVPGCRILIGEGCGATEYETDHCFETLGYTELAARKQVELVDLNHQPLTSKALAECGRWPEMHLPELLDHCFLFSIPVLKAHSLADVTLTMKNMMGCAPPSRFQAGSSWKKSKFHTRMQESIFDLNRYRTPDFTLLDATIGMAQAHLWGPHCDPPVNRLLAGFDPVAIDAYGSSLLGKDWKRIGHIAMANGKLGRAEPFELIEVK